MVTQGNQEGNEGSAPARRGRNRPRRSLVNSALILLFVLISSALLVSSTFSPSRTSATTDTGSTVAFAARPSTGCGKPAPFTAGTSEDTALVSGGRERYYRLHIPAGYAPMHQYPLVLNFHGHGGSAAHQEAYTGFSRLADAHGFVVVYPQGVQGLDGKTGWSSGGVGKPRLNDVLFTNDLINKLQGHLCIDPLRIYATGFSNGGGMTALLACRLTTRIAAFAPVSGSYYAPLGGCHPSRPVSILEIHGTDDKVVPFGGNPAIGLIGSSTWIQNWAARDGCATSFVTTSKGNGITASTWTHCRDGSTVIHYRIAGGAHVWPGAPSLKRVALGDTHLDASTLIWSFFVAHPLAAIPMASAKATSTAHNNSAQSFKS